MPLSNNLRTAWDIDVDVNFINELFIARTVYASKKVDYDILCYEFWITDSKSSLRIVVT